MNRILLALILVLSLVTLACAADPDALVATDNKGTTITLLARACSAPAVLANVETANAILVKNKAPNLIVGDEFYAGVMLPKGGKPEDICWTLVGSRVVVINGAKYPNVYAIPPSLFRPAVEI